MRRIFLLFTADHPLRNAIPRFRVVDPASGFAIRALDSFPPLLSHQQIAKAMEGISKGIDLHKIKNRLKHDDALTVGALIKKWYQTNNMDPPPFYVRAPQ